MKVEFLRPADVEFNEAIDYYNLQRSNLGYEFEDEVKATIKRIVDYPEAWAPISTSKRTRRCITNRFQYGIIYQIRQDFILIVAVMHLHRAPQTWQSRLLERLH